MKVLIWTNKYGLCVYDASTPEKELKGWKLAFNLMEDNGDFECCPPDGKDEKDWYKKAKKGDLLYIYIKRLLKYRSDTGYEYENFVIHDVEGAD